MRGAKGADAGAQPRQGAADMAGAGAQPGAPTRRACPAGKELTRDERTRSVTHAPRNMDRAPICRGAATHVGCARKAVDCPNSRGPIFSLEG
eukprot:8897799-Pyramimonas_sp.AAC.1